MRKFEEAEKFPVDFETITLPFFYKFVSYEETFLSRNTIAKDMRILKRVMGEAVDVGYTTNKQYKFRKFSYAAEDTASIYLTDVEIMKFYKYDLTDLPRDERIRDQFVFGTCTGLSFFDFNRVKKHNIMRLMANILSKFKARKRIITM